jgi:hypothetical protein
MSGGESTRQDAPWTRDSILENYKEANSTPHHLLNLVGMG